MPSLILRAKLPSKLGPGLDCGSMAVESQDSLNFFFQPCMDGGILKKPCTNSSCMSYLLVK